MTPGAKNDGTDLTPTNVCLYLEGGEKGSTEVLCLMTTRPVNFNFEEVIFFSVITSSHSPLHRGNFYLKILNRKECNVIPCFKKHLITFSTPSIFIFLRAVLKKLRCKRFNIVKFIYQFFHQPSYNRNSVRSAL